MKNILKQKNGQAAILITVCLIGIVSLLALVLDTGRIFVEHSKLQRGVDAAVLAAAQDLPIGKKINGTPSTEESIKEIVTTALSYNLESKKQTYTKNENLNKFLHFSDNEDLGTKSITKEAVTLEKDYTVDIQFSTPANSISGDKTIIAITISRKMKTRLAMILGYNEWVISAQQLAMIGPIQSVPNVLPLAVVVDTDKHGKPKEIPLNQTVRLSNTTHDSNVENQLTYIPVNIQTPGKKQNVGYTTLDQASVQFITSTSNKKSLEENFIFTSKTKNATGLRIRTKDESNNVFLGLCKGFNDLISTSAFKDANGKEVVGCINTDESTENTNIKYNFSLGTINSAYGYLSDPRLLILPIVQYSTNYTNLTNNLTKRNKNIQEFKVIGFALFFYEYGHYTSTPASNEYYRETNLGTTVLEPPSMFEMVGFFTTAVFEGPIDSSARDYGISGIEYVSPDNEKLFSFNMG